MEELPSYLGLGTLIAGSVSRQSGQITADYANDDEIVYRVSLSDTNCRIIEFFDGQQIGTTVDSTLKNAFIRHMMSLTPYANPRFEKIYHQICDGRNIYVRFPQRPDKIFFPAGYIFALRQPVVSSNDSQIQAIKAQIRQMDKTSLLKAEDEHPAILLRLMQSGEVHREEIKVVDFSTLLLHLTSAVDWLWQSRLVPPEKEYRLTILDLAEILPGNLPIYIGDSARGFVTFSVVTTDALKTSMNEITEAFYNLSLNFLESLHK